MKSKLTTEEKYFVDLIRAVAREQIAKSNRAPSATVDAETLEVEKTIIKMRDYIARTGE